MSREKLLYASAIVGALYLSRAAFTPAVRRAILERDKFKCTRCGATDHLEAAHIWHEKLDPSYNKPSNGRILCIEHHLQDHINRHGRNGMSKEKNTEAIKSLQARVIYQSNE